METKKQPFPGPPCIEKQNHTKCRETHFTLTIKFTYTLSLSLFLLTWLLVLFRWFPIYHTNTQNDTVEVHEQLRRTTCNDGVQVYIYDLPPEFNVGLLEDCRHLNMYTNMCPHVANRGLGQPLNGAGGSWFATQQFLAEMIFHARLENHPCRTWDPAGASLFYVPFYGGLHASSKFREFDHGERDKLAVRLAEYVQNQRWWKRNGGKDHFMALGRTAWDFMRREGVPDFGANILLNLPPVRNMSVLVVEKQPWTGKNQQGIPYPSYFHPATSTEMLTWQDSVRQSPRPHLFSFIGAPRKGVGIAAVRDEILRQCSESARCELVRCGVGPSKCHEPREVLRVMMNSKFCLQPPGDSFTRRSTFDSVLAGCVPVFFSRHTVYSQYAWFVPDEPTSYSVFIDGQDPNGKMRRIEEELMKIPEEDVEKMREKVIEMIPAITYAHPNATDTGFRDVVDVALSNLSKHTRTKLRSFEA